jgi:hypothetical protein
LPATDAREVIILNSQFGAGSTTYSPATWYLGLSTTTPNDDGSNFTEPTGGSYARVSITNNTTNFPAATTSSGTTTKSNGAAFTFANPTGSWGTVTYWGLFTASSGGTPEFTQALDNPVTIQSGNTPVQFAIGDFKITCD